MTLFGSSGIRRIADRHLLEIALRTGLAVGKTYRRVIVGSDTRTSGGAVKLAFASGLLGAGAEYRDGGVTPTPTLALAAGRFGAGAMITASHNPPQYNGIKLVNNDGSAFDGSQREQVETAVLGDSLSAAPWEEMRDSFIYDGAIEEHIQHIQKDFPRPLKLKVVLDCGCGATSVISPYLLRRLGCEVIALNCYPSGFFPHDVEPLEANLGDLIAATRQSGADLGIAHDGDGDRMMAVDDLGRFIPGDKLLGIFAQEMKAKEVVTTLDASMAIEELGFKVTRTRIGDIYVSEELKKSGDFGGEPSGSWVFPKSSLCPDGVYAAAKLLAIASQSKLSSLIDRIPHYPIIRGSASNAGITVAEVEKRLPALKPLSVSNIDGIRLAFNDGWLLVRPSGTEPKIRLTAEARSKEQARKLYDAALQIVEKCRSASRERS
ncbi:MAG: phosphoglucosamine mutase [Chloroflexi bacterium]|nr:phosphoglucosamine mutase [Chloroflexota bacterium]